MGVRLSGGRQKEREKGAAEAAFIAVRLLFRADRFWLDRHMWSVVHPVSWFTVVACCIIFDDLRNWSDML